ncbi:MAG: hypothetical protein ABIP79_05095 [Chitinophagaceae bacterium]
MTYVLFALLAYILYKFIFKFVIPVYQASQKLKKGFGEMQEKMQDHMKQQNAQTNQSTASPAEPKVKAGEYIEFEELK